MSTCGRRERVWKVARPVRSGARFLPTVWVIVSLGVARLPVAVAVDFQSSLSLPDSLRRRSSLNWLNLGILEKEALLECCWPFVPFTVKC